MSMPLLTIYFQLHQPCRLHPERDKFLWEETNRAVFLKVAEKCYLPALGMMSDLVTKYPDFKITFSMSGTFLEQAELYRPEVIEVLKKLVDAGRQNNQVEILDETYYHSLTSLFADPKKQEFREQVTLHRNMMMSLFGISPTSFRNTELMYNDDIARTVADMGYQSILCEKRADMFIQEKIPISSNAVFKAKDNRLVVIPRNRDLSDDIAFRFPHHWISPEEYATNIAGIDGEAVLLGYDFEHIGEHIWQDKGIFEFWKSLPEALAEHPNIVLTNPTEIAERFKDVDCPVAHIHELATSSWADAGRDTFGWLGTWTQSRLFREIEKLESDVRRSGEEIMTRWRHLTTSDHIYFLHERMGEDYAVHSYFNPYGGSITEASHVLTRKLDDLHAAIRKFEILKKYERTAVLLIAPETGSLPEDMGALAKYISGKSGGLGEVIAALCHGLTERGIDCHLTTLNLKRRFQKECRMDEHQWREVIYRIDPKKIHLVSSQIFADLPGAYAGNPILNAAEFQKRLVNDTIKTVRAKSRGRLILHSHDWMGGGIVTAYAKSRNIPTLHTVHNSFTGHIPIEMLFGIHVDQLSEYLYFSEDRGRRCIDCQATAIKNASLINFVGKRFLEEIVNDYFLDRFIIPWSVRQEVKAKYASGSAFFVQNAPSPSMYPEHCRYLARRYGPEDVIAAKRENLVAFQRKTGLVVDPEAILLYWPSRLDPLQKGVELLEFIAQKFVVEHGDVQIAIVADGTGQDRSHEEIMGRIAWGSGGKIAYYGYSEELSMLGFAAASDVFGASLYEPCGQIDMIANLFGATATNRDTGGYHDKIRELELRIDGAPEDRGNGFLFRDYDPSGLWYGLERTVRFHRKSLEIRAQQMKRIMKEAREKYDLKNMIDEYVKAYERLNGNKPLT